MKGNTTLPWLTLGLIVLIPLQLWYNAATVTDLKWLLYPTSYLVSIILGSTPVFSADNGYILQEMNIILGQTCSGFTFLLLFVALIYFRFQNFYSKILHKLSFLFIVLIVAYPTTLLMNTSRILIGVLGQQIADAFLQPQPHRVLHELLGLFCYMAALVFIYKIAYNYHIKTLPHEKIVSS